MPAEDMNEIFGNSDLDALLKQLGGKEEAYPNESFRRFAEFLVKEDVIPERMGSTFWATKSKDVSLSNLSDKDVERLINDFDDMVDAYLISLPSGAFTFHDDFALSQLRIKWILRLKRSKEGFERKMLATQIKQQVFEETEQPKGGLISGIKNFFLGRRR